MTCVAKLLLAPLMLLAACNSTRTWTDGFSLAFHRPGTSLLALRYAEEEQWHEAQAISVKEPKLAQCIVSFDNAEDSECWETEEVNMNFFQGVGLAREIGGARSVLGYTNKNILFIHAGVGLVFGESPDLTLREVASSAPSIVHIADSEWLVAFQDMTGRLHIRRYTYGPGGLSDENIAPPIPDNNSITGRPAVAYHDGRLVISWLRWGMPEPRFYYAVARYQPGDSTPALTAVGLLPQVDGFYPEPQADPALAHDGAGNFYLAVLRRAGSLTEGGGLSYDALHIYSSPDGTNWTFLPNGPASSFNYGLSNVSMAAWPNGEILAAISTYPESRVLRFRNGSWAALDLNIFRWDSDNPGAFSLIRSQYLSRAQDD